MTQAKPDPKENPQAAESAPVGERVETDAPGEAIDLGAIGIEDPVSILEAEKAELKDQLLRALAETENIRRRNQREREDTAKFATTNFARDMLAVADNLRRAIEAIPVERTHEDHDLRMLYEGVELVERDLLSAFERHGIKRVDPIGQKFDPNLHQAMFEVENADTQPGTVVECMAPGYTIHDRLLRAAMVGVAKAPAAAAGTRDAGAKSE